MRAKIFPAFLVTLLMLPLGVLARTTDMGFEGVYFILRDVFKWAATIIIGLAVIYFLWGIMKYIQSAGDEAQRKEGVMMMTYGIIGLFVMVSVWGLVRVLENTFIDEVDTDYQYQPPEVPNVYP